MVKTHQSLHNDNETLYRQALSHHGTALRAVRNMLKDPSQAYSVNTACAIYLIMACQVRLGLVVMNLHLLTGIGIGASLGPGCACYATYGYAFGDSSQRFYGGLVTGIPHKHVGLLFAHHSE